MLLIKITITIKVYKLKKRKQKNKSKIQVLIKDISVLAMEIEDFNIKKPRLRLTHKKKLTLY